MDDFGSGGSSEINNLTDRLDVGDENGFGCAVEYTYEALVESGSGSGDGDADTYEDAYACIMNRLISGSENSRGFLSGYGNG